MARGAGGDPPVARPAGGDPPAARPAGGDPPAARPAGGDPPAARLETARLILRPFERGDLDAMSAVLGDPLSMRFYPHPFARHESRAWIERNRARFDATGLGLWAVTVGETGEVVGDCGAVPQVVDGAEELELGWHLHPAHQGRGYATEAAIAWRKHAFAVTGRRRLISLILEANTPSRRVAERIGMEVWKTTLFAGLPHLAYVINR